MIKLKFSAYNTERKLHCENNKISTFSAKDIHVNKSHTFQSNLYHLKAQKLSISDSNQLKKLLLVLVKINTLKKQKQISLSCVELIQN